MLSRLEAVRRDLSNLPNVLAVGVGVKESGGQFTDQISYRVYVSAKKDPAELAPGETIPKAIGEYPTDVLVPLVITNDSDVCGNERRTLKNHRPLQGGIAVSTDATSYGTLGWFGKLDVDDTPVLLTNKHVLWDTTDATIIASVKTAQPQLGEPSKCCCCECGSDNVIGESLVGIRSVGTPTATSVDCALAKINAGVAINLVIANASTDEVLRVTGTNTAVVGQTVRKIGARSGFTRGTVIHIGDVAAAPADPGGGTISIITGQVLVIPAAAETYQVREGVCKFAFSNSGDSGAVILNDAGEIVALNWGGDRTSYTVGVTIANNIANVMNAFSTNGFPLSLSVSPPGGGDMDLVRSSVPRAVAAPQPASAAAAAPLNVLERLRDANRGSLLHFLFERHHREVLRLVNHERAVTVAWRRHEGPAFVAALARAARVESYRVPFSIDGITREALLRAMETALEQHGSRELKADIARYRDDAYALAGGGEALEELAQILLQRGLIDTIPSELTPAAS